MEAIVLYPTPAIGHLISMVELGKLILTSKLSLSIHILIAAPPYNPADTAAYLASVSAAVPSFTFHNLPAVSLPQSLTSSSPNHETLTFELIRLNKPLVSKRLSSIAESQTIHAVIMDSFCGTTLDVVTTELGFAAYYFYSSGASALSSALHLPILHKSTTKSFKDLGRDTLLDIPGVPPIPAIDMPKLIQDRDDAAYKYYLECCSYLPRAAGVIVNTFEALEPRVVKAISDGLPVPDLPAPRIYCIGPLINSSRPSRHQCLSWLDSQPSRSVVFLCFGSLGVFSAEQVREIAAGLEKSRQRFLWVLRSPPKNESRNLAVSSQLDLDTDDLLPDGFLERTRERGLVVENWAPQVAVLSHDSVGGFVTHCGWNSVLESVSTGVPMIAWPLYAEQRLNRIVLVEEIGIALSMDQSGRSVVRASEVERRVNELMASYEGGDDSVSQRVLRMKNEAQAALGDGGSSRMALAQLIQSWN